jgi:predicted XRE-type DNA-binding protein
MEITPGSSNVFEDIGFPAQEADELACKAQLVRNLRKAIERRGLTQVQAAELCGTDQPTISKVLRGGLHLVSTDRLFAWFVRLGVAIRISMEDSQDACGVTVEQFPPSANAAPA